MEKILLISEKTIKDYSIVSDNLDGKFLQSAIMTSQDIELETIIGVALTDKLCSMVKDGSIQTNEKYKLLLDKYITPFLVYQTVSKAILSSSYHISNTGVYLPIDEKKQNQDLRTNLLLQQQYANYANDYGVKMKDFLLKNIKDYPEYRKCVNYEREEGVRLSGLFLDDVPEWRKSPYWYIGK